MDMRAHVEYDLKCKIDEVLSDSEVTLRDALTLIRNNREELRKPTETQILNIRATPARQDKQSPRRQAPENFHKKIIRRFDLCVF